MKPHPLYGTLQGYECCADAILARYGVVELPTLNDPDDDGQIYTDAAELRIDTSDPNGNRVFLPGGNQTSPNRLRQEAADYLAAANRVEAHLSYVRGEAANG